VKLCSRGATQKVKYGHIIIGQIKKKKKDVNTAAWLVHIEIFDNYITFLHSLFVSMIAASCAGKKHLGNLFTIKHGFADINTIF